MINLSQRNSNITNYDVNDNSRTTANKQRKKLEAMLTCLISKSSKLAVSLNLIYLY